MAETTRKSRSDQSQEIDERIVRVAIELINDVGPDLFTATELARRTGLTTGAIYRRYDSTDDVLKQIWRECWPGLRGFAEASYHGDSRSESEFEFAISEYVKPSSIARAAALIMSCACRVPLIAQQVRDDVWHFCSPTEVMDPVETGLRFASLSLALGRCLLSEVVAIDSDALREVARVMIGTPEVQELIEVDASPRVYAMVSELQIDADLLEAGMSLISQVGFEGTTASRIARETARPFSQFDKQFGNKIRLMERLVEGLIPPVLDFENQMRDAQGPEESAAAMRSWNAVENSTVRKLVAEIVLVANTREAIRDMVAASFAARARVLSDLGVEGIGLVRGGWHFGNAYFVGMSTLGLLVPTVDMDFSGAVTALISMRDVVTGAVIAGLSDAPSPRQFL